MKRIAALLLMVSSLLVLFTIPIVAQDETTTSPQVSAAPDGSALPAATPGPTLRPLPTAVPSSEGPVVQGVFFFSPTCGHCEYVITQVLPGLFADNGGDYVITFDQSVLPEQPSFYLMSNGQLQLLMVDTSQPDGGAMFEADSVRLGMDQAGVPRLDFADTYLVGSGDIPDRFPDIVRDGLAGEGIAWPIVPGLGDAIAPFIADGSVPGSEAAATAEPVEATTPPAASSAPAATTTPVAATVEPTDAAAEPSPAATALAVLPVGDDQGPLDKIGNDPAGNGIAIVVLIGLILSLIAAPLLAARGSLPAFPSWLVIVLAVVGFGVAAYLANIETTGSQAVCGPVGDCNAVQESEYAKMLGIPIGVLGMVGYLLIGGLWVVARLAHGRAADLALVLLAVGAFAGTVFSAYLTFLEPFVIGATCMWCITSAVVMMALLWITAGPGWPAYRRLRGGPRALAPGARAGAGQSSRD